VLNKSEETVMRNSAKRKMMQDKKRAENMPRSARKGRAAPIGKAPVSVPKTRIKPGNRTKPTVREKPFTQPGGPAPAKKYAKGGKVRGSGCATQGTKTAKIV